MLKGGSGHRAALEKSLRCSEPGVRLAASTGGGAVHPPGFIFGKYRDLFCADLRRRRGECGKIRPQALREERAAVLRTGAAGDAGKLYYDVSGSGAGGGGTDHPPGRTGAGAVGGDDPGREAVSGADGYLGRPGEEQHREPSVLPAVREREGVLCGGWLRGLRPLCEALSAEQYPPGGRKACLGQEMHPVYGLHLRMPGPGRGVWKADSGEGAVLSGGGWDVGRSGERAGIAHRRPAAGG